MGRALDDRNTESRGGSAVGGVANLGDSLSAELGCALVELDCTVLVGQTDNVLTIRDGVEADGRLLNNDHVLKESVDVVPCLIGVDAVNGEDVAEVVPCSGGAVGIGEDDLALECGIEEVFVGLDVQTEFLLKLGVDAEANGGEVIHAVEAVGGAVAFHLLVVVVRDPCFEYLGVLVAVGVSKATPSNVALGVAGFGLNLRGELTGGTGDDLDLDVGVHFIEAGLESIKVGFGHGGVEDEGVAQVFLDCRVFGGSRSVSSGGFILSGLFGRCCGLSAGAQCKDHAKRQYEC